MIQKAIGHLINHCGNLKRDEKSLILYDDKTKKIAKLFSYYVSKKTKYNAIINVGNLKFHGEKLPKKIEREMCRSNLILCLTKFSLAHSYSRIKASKRGARFLSLPDYSINFIRDKSIIVNYKKISKEMKKYSNILTKGKKIKIHSKFGTNIDIFIKGRKANFCPGYVNKAGDLGSPPDIETNVSPLEKLSKGTLIVNGSITHPKIKLLKEKVKLEIKNGKIIKIYSRNSKVKRLLIKIFGKSNSKRRVLAECGIGFNPKAKLSGHMLTDEGSRGCVHIGFGSNHTVGGKNNANFHIDLILKKTNLEVDGKYLVKNGSLYL